MHKSITLKIKEKHDEFIDKNLIKTLNNVSRYSDDLSIAEIFSILTDYLSKTILDDSKLKYVDEIGQEIGSNEKISKIFNEMGSAYLNGIALINTGLSLMNLDKFADKAVNESIDKGDFLVTDLELLKDSNVKNIKKTTLDRVNHYLVTGEKNIPIIKKEAETNKCSCSNCNCSSSEKAKTDTEKKLIKLIELLNEQMSVLSYGNYDKEELNDKEVEISDNELLLLMLESLTR